MLTVGKDAVEVERRLASGVLVCPGCGGRLGPWGHARARVVREAAGIGWRLRPRRSICAGCGRTHVLLPVSCLGRRADAVSVIGVALVRAAAGWGHRRIAQLLDRPAGTVRGWLRRFGSRAGPLRASFTALWCALDADPVLAGPAGSELSDAVVAVLGAADAVVRRFAGAAFALSPWEVAAAVTSGQLLAVGTAVGLINTSCLW